MLECVGENGFEDAARCDERQAELTVFERTPAIHVRLFENRTELGIVHEFEASDLRTCRRLTADSGLLTAHCDRRTIEDPKNALHDQRQRRLLDHTSRRRAHKEGLTELTREPVGLAAPRQVAHEGGAVLLPDTRGSQSRTLRPLDIKRLAQFVAATD
jgi:cation diffusion facilitator CzcD-associated flavoprotein CzcO